MIRKILLIIGLLIGSLGLHAGVASPASAHVNSCTLAAYAPKPLWGTSLIRGTVKWYCPPPRHHSHQTITAVVQYKVERFGPDYWRGIPPGNRTSTANMNSAMTTTAECANGEKEYRTLMRFEMHGLHGSRRHEKTSGVTTQDCNER